MKTQHLLPYGFKKVGWILFIPSLIAGILLLIFQPGPSFTNAPVFAVADGQFFGKILFFKIVETQLLDEFISVGLIVGALFIAFSREREEDEFIAKVRLDSLLWATYVNYGILLLCIIFVYEMAFYWVMVLNMFTLLFFFIIRFKLVLYKSRIPKQKHEELYQG